MKVPPIQHLVRWRITMAARLLRDQRAGLVRVPEVTGYEAEASFSRAFKKEFTVSPGPWRVGKKAQPGD